MSYGKLYGKEVFRATVNGTEYIFTCYGQSTNSGFRHLCVEGEAYTDTDYNRIKGDIVAKVCYINRTWESFKYETVLRKAIQNTAPNKEVQDELRAILINKTGQDEREKSEAFINSFKQEFNNLSEANKEHLKRGLGDNLIQSEEQANAVLGVMKFMKFMNLFQKLEEV